MRLTQYTDFSLRVLIYLGLHPDRRCTIKEIAERYQVSRNHLMKVVQQLAGKGFLDATRGNGGGLMLARPPRQINLADVIAEMEPDFGMVECMRPGNQCVITPDCELACMLAEATRDWLDTMRKYSLADLLGKQKAASMRILLKTA